MESSLLHLSDLHRDPEQPLGNGPLVESLRIDLRSYTEPPRPIMRPEVVIVSGDLVQGVSPDDDLSRLEAQYRQAHAFLVELADIFCGGDRNRIVIVPGNHDVAYPLFMDSLTELDTSPELWPGQHERLHRKRTSLRWSWKERKLYEVRDWELYERRMQLFAEFYEQFYEGTRSFSLRPADQYDVFDFPSIGITIVGFSSCFRNDPFNTAGNIHPDALAAAAKEIQQSTYSGRLLFAVWHHSINAPPPHVDFMDEEIVQILLGYGFTLGFHGHHHRPEKIDSRSRFGQSGEITVISAATLCGGKQSLPIGRPRGYNIVEIKSEEHRGKLHVRRMRNDILAHPLWGPHHIGAVELHVEFALSPLKRLEHREDVVLRVSRAEGMQREGRHKEAADILEDLAGENSVARRLLLESLAELEDARRIVEHFDPPRADNERIYLMESLYELRRTERLSRLLESEGIANSQNPQVRMTRDRCRQRIAE